MDASLLARVTTYPLRASVETTPARPSAGCSSGTDCWSGSRTPTGPTLHLLALGGGAGRVELDANPNPLRTELAPLDLGVSDGTLPLPTAPGLGVEPDPQALRLYALDPAA